MGSLYSSMVRSDFCARYAGTALGFFWALAQPLLTLAIYAFVFSVGFRSAPVANAPYALWLFCGLVPWFLFSEVWSAASASLQQYAPLVKKTRFPTWLLPLVRAGSACLLHGIFLGLLVIASPFFGVMPQWLWVQALYYSLCALALGLGLGILCAALTPFFRDVQQGIGLLLQLGFWLTPLAWSPELFSPAIQSLLKLNPLYYAVQGYRDSFFFGVPFWQKPLWTAGFWAATLAVGALGVWVFRRAKGGFADAL